MEISLMRLGCDHRNVSIELSHRWQGRLKQYWMRGRMAAQGWRDVGKKLVIWCEHHSIVMDYPSSRNNPDKGIWRCEAIDTRQTIRIIATRPPRSQVNGVPLVKPYVVSTKSTTNCLGSIAIKTT